MEPKDNSVEFNNDSLNRKWRDSRFIPRFICAAHVPGEGLCYFYDDGTRCKAVVNGQAVDRYLGVTTEGKARERVLRACTACREKKVKCDAVTPRCTQCVKGDRICRFKNPSKRCTYKSRRCTYPSKQCTYPSPTLTALRDALGEAVDHQNAMSESGSLDATTIRSSSLQPRSRMASPGSEPRAHIMGSLIHDTSALEELDSPGWLEPRLEESALASTWRNDPWLANPQQTSDAASCFFQIADGAVVLRFLPERLFYAWVDDQVAQKTLEELMLSYALLAVDNMLSNGSSAIASECAQVAYHAQLTTRGDCLEKVQTRLLLSFYFTAISDSARSQRMLLEALVEAAGLCFHQEHLGGKIDEGRRLPFGMSRDAFDESKRRTCWTLFLLERLGSPIENTTLLNPEYMSLRLPTDFETHSQASHMPWFDSYEIRTAKMNSPYLALSTTAVEMAHVWSICVQTARHIAKGQMFSAALIPLLAGLRPFQFLVDEIHPYGESELRQAAYVGHLGPFIMLHLLYYHATIMIHRYLPVDEIVTTENRHEQFQICQQHAHSLLRTIRAIADVAEFTPPLLVNTPPIAALAAAGAVDVLTAVGAVSELDTLIEDISAAARVIERPRGIWKGFTQYLKVIDERCCLLRRIRDHGDGRVKSTEAVRLASSQRPGQEEVYDTWMIMESMEKRYPRDRDVVYGPLLS